MALSLKKVGSDGSEREGSESGADEGGLFEYFGWVYHLGANSIGREFCHLRFLYIKGKHVCMYKRDPHENPGIVWIHMILKFFHLVAPEIWSCSLDVTFLFCFLSFPFLDFVILRSITLSLVVDCLPMVPPFANSFSYFFYSLLILRFYDQDSPWCRNP